MDIPASNELNPIINPVPHVPRALSLSTGFKVYILGLCIIFGDRFVHSGFPKSGFTQPIAYLRLVLFFVGVPVVFGLLIAATLLLFRRAKFRNCLLRGIALSLTGFGILLICFTLLFWVERLVNARAATPGAATPGKPRNQFMKQNQTSFKTLLETANDFDLVNGTFTIIGDRHYHWIDASQYTPEERVIMLVWHSTGIIGNGGFEYLFSDDFDGDPDYRITAECYKTAGLVRGYEAFEEAFKLFPNGIVPTDSETRISQYEVTDKSARDELNTKHWKDSWDNLTEKKLAQYIRDNTHNLKHLDN